VSSVERGQAAIPLSDDRNEVTGHPHEFAQWLRSVRTGRGLSQEWVANAANIAVTTYARLEQAPRSGQRRSIPSLATLAKVCQVLEIDPADLVGLRLATVALADSDDGGVRRLRSRHRPSRLREDGAS